MDEPFIVCTATRFAIDMDSAHILQSKTTQGKVNFYIIIYIQYIIIYIKN